MAASCSVFFGRDNRIVAARGQEYGPSGQIWQLLRNQRNHRAEQDRATQDFRAQQQHAGSDVCSVRIANRDHPTGIKLVLLRGRSDEIREFVRSADEVFLIENAFGQSSEKARHAILQNLPARAEQSRARKKIAADVQQIVLVAARAMQQKKHRSGASLRGGQESMNEA